MKKFKVLLLIFALTFSIGAIGQALSYNGVFSYAMPQGDAFKDANGDKTTSFGLSYEVDLLYFHGFLDDRLGLGLTYFGSALFGEDNSSAFDIGIYGLSLVGAKGMYRLLPIDEPISPYGALGLGVSTFSTPEVTSGGAVLVPADKSFSFGLRPELGLDLGGFIISVAYFVPMKYNVSGALGSFKGTAGALTIGLGYRGYFSF